MSTKNIPYSKNALGKWSAMKVEAPEHIWFRKKDGVTKPLSTWEINRMYEHPKRVWDGMVNYNLTKTPLVELVKQPGYEKFKSKFNWLYENFSEENYQLVWQELQDYNEVRKQQCIQKCIIARAEYFLEKEIAEWEYHFGEIPERVKSLTDNQRELLLDRARVCYGLVPEEVKLTTKDYYTVPLSFIKDYTDSGKPVYWSEEELNKANIRNNIYSSIVGKYNLYSQKLQRLAEDAVIRNAMWFAKFNGTEFDLREHREVEGDETANKMVPITDLQGPDNTYAVDVEFRDFLTPIYTDDEDPLMGDEFEDVDEDEDEDEDIFSYEEDEEE